MDPLAANPLRVIEWCNAVLLATAIACIVGALAVLTVGIGRAEDAAQGESHV